ncbi:GumC family protein [Alkalilimnicola sp. S0819]|uniref:GumC family protein n=1 Tax=Alkalilimnicola sp. S0819 TaxID=2613922 RepID=UPI0012618591|nr:hypothetical protein [Alkalilimnicola sp. S0819]KAB7627875.1 hypothetical protein F3N43_02560 [Alkalilimnicola sp. S0819]MPQ15511.1 hypothetical protein [Alkalilimnicola sp. S0819]
MAAREEMELRDYLRVLRRRKGALALGLFTIVALTVALVVLMPKSYRSTATIQIERRAIPAEWVSGPSLGYLSERLHVLSQRIKSEENLRAIAERYAVFPPGSNWQTSGDWLKSMRKAITVEKVDIEVTDPQRGRVMLVTVAFDVSFDGRTPEVAQQVSQELASLYLQDNQMRQSETAAVVGFLEEQSERLGARMDQLEQTISEFKSTHLQSLPELTPVNRSLYDRAMADVATTRETIRNLEQRRIALSTRLAGLSPQVDIYSEDGRRVSTAGERLRLLRSQYARARAMYSETHPDVLRLKSEIQALDGAARGGGGALSGELARLRLELERLRDTRSAEHPDVIALQRQIRGMESQFAGGGGVGGAEESPVNNPAYIAVRGELDAVEADLRTQRSKLDGLVASMDDYERRLFASPGVEKEYQALLRQRDSLNERYREVSDRLLGAQMTMQLEGEQVGERLHLVRAANLPSKPRNPTPMAIMLFGIVLGMGGGVGAAAFSEYWDRGVRGRDGVRSVLKQPPLIIMPYVDNRKDRQRKSRRRYLRAILIVVAGLLLVAFLHQRGPSLLGLDTSERGAPASFLPGWWPQASEPDAAEQ